MFLTSDQDIQETCFANCPEAVVCPYEVFGNPMLIANTKEIEKVLKSIACPANFYNILRFTFTSSVSVPSLHLSKWVSGMFQICS